MADTTDYSSIPYPELSDVANMQTAASNLANGLDKLVIPSFADSATRDTHAAAPTDGMVCYNQDLHTLEVYRGAWIALRETFTSVKTSNTTYVSNVTNANVPDMFFPVQANATYIFDAFFVYVPGVGQMKVAVNGPGGMTVQWGANSLWKTVTNQTRTAGEVEKFVQTVVGSSISIGGLDTGASRMFADAKGIVVTSGTPGNVNVQASQFSSNVSGAVFVAGSWIRATRVL